VGAEECLLVTRTLEAESRIQYTLSDADPSVPTQKLVRAHAERLREYHGA